MNKQSKMQQNDSLNLNPTDYPELSEYSEETVKKWGESLTKQFGGTVESNLAILETDLEMEAAKALGAEGYRRYLEEKQNTERQLSHNEDEENSEDADDRKKRYLGRQGLLYEDELM